MNELDKFELNENELNEWIAKNLFGYRFCDGQWYNHNENPVSILPNFLQHHSRPVMNKMQNYGKNRISMQQDSYMTIMSFDDWRTKGEHKKLGIAIALAAKAAIEAMEQRQKILFSE